jgi:DNA-binding HxlR family transcriptional regulator
MPKVSRQRYAIEVLEERYMMQILLALSEQPEVYRGQLYSTLSTGSKTVADKINKLKKLGLVSERVEGKKPIRRYLFLTERGKRIAEALMALERMIGTHPDKASRDQVADGNVRSR